MAHYTNEPIVLMNCWQCWHGWVEAFAECAMAIEYSVKLLLTFSIHFKMPLNTQRRCLWVLVRMLLSTQWSCQWFHTLWSSHQALLLMLSIQWSCCWVLSEAVVEYSVKLFWLLVETIAKYLVKLSISAHWCCCWILNEAVIKHSVKLLLSTRQSCSWVFSLNTP